MFDFLKRKREGEDMMPPDLPQSPFPENDSPQGYPPLGNDSAMPNFPSNPSPPQSSFPPLESTPSRNRFSQQDSYQQPQQMQQSSGKEEIILAKLDTLRSMLDVLNQRLANLESKLDSQRRW